MNWSFPVAFSGSSRLHSTAKLRTLNTPFSPCLPRKGLPMLDLEPGSSSSFAGIKWQHRASLATSPLKPPEMIPLDDPEIGDIIKGGGPQDIDIDAIDPFFSDMVVSVTMPRFQVRKENSLNGSKTWYCRAPNLS